MPDGDGSVNPRASGSPESSMDPGVVYELKMARGYSLAEFRRSFVRGDRGNTGLSARNRDVTPSPRTRKAADPSGRKPDGRNFLNRGS